MLLAAAFAVCGLAVFSSCIKVETPEHTHSFGEWTTVSEPTCIEKGLRERLCACGEKESEEIEALGHDYVKGVCLRCGEAEPFTEGLVFALTENDVGYTVSGYRGVSAEVYIPSYYQGLPVASIGKSAFYDRSRLTNVTIGDGVTSIGDWAFYDCDNLTRVTIGDGVTIIGSNVFSFCHSLRSVVIGDGVTSIGDWAFSGCDSFGTVYYTGNEAEWNEIEIGFGNSDLKDANIIYNYKGE